MLNLNCILLKTHYRLHLLRSYCLWHINNSLIHHDYRLRHHLHIYHLWRRHNHWLGLIRCIIIHYRHLGKLHVRRFILRIKLVHFLPFFLFIFMFLIILSKIWLSRLFNAYSSNNAACDDKKTDEWTGTANNNYYYLWWVKSIRDIRSNIFFRAIILIVSIIFVIYFTIL